ncbi:MULTISPECIES: YdeI/OmpD-associated family protein [unclassified Sphingomonas]|uniref:YdeI/OmpD-associated family protein n=1 Tax=unclassified Sphingomonas TaxID=196159 RepID=UPI002151C28D|nr:MULTISPECIES: YdeI/OmpD-associated family protein [unclassified Sphingomonas]MCR5869843.1 YdeI/OmpD-associated family protein [Sphingomonas sp. J344]UUX98456.1 YdeI/OmpD-associated family protein [Sphingomonas sp. J315]
MTRDPRIDAYIDKQAAFAQPILIWLRDRVHAACPDVEEGIKWSMPAFSHEGRPLAHMAAFKAHASFGFWYRDAMETGKEGEAMGQFGRIASLADLPDAAVMEAQVREAVALIESGAIPKRTAKEAKPEAEVPPALSEALARDPEAAAKFDAFPPGARRDYCDWIADAKRDATRDRRVAEAIGWIREGKKRHWKYESC